MIPILILTYNRPDHLRRVLNTLIELKQVEIYVSIDGPRSDIDKRNQEEILHILKASKKSFKKIQVVTREFNLGCNLGVVSGIDWFFSYIDEGIILEDDCIPDSEFFAFILSNKHKVLLNSRIGMIAGHNPLKKMSHHNVIESRYSFITGWYTRSEIWNEIRKDFYKIRFPKLKNRYYEKQDLSEMVFWWAAATRARLDRYDTWDSSFSIRMWENGYRCIIPPRNFITNIGYGVGAMHTTDPTGGVFLDKYEKLKLNNGDFDRLINAEYFKIKGRHSIKPVFRIILDLMNGKKRRNFEVTLKRNKEFQQRKNVI